MTDPKELERLEDIARWFSESPECPVVVQGSVAAEHAADLRSLLAQLRAVGEERDDAREMLRDLVTLDAEASAIRGGGPGWAERWEKAMARASAEFTP